MVQLQMQGIIPPLAAAAENEARVKGVCQRKVVTSEGPRRGLSGSLTHCHQPETTRLTWILATSGEPASEREGPLQPPTVFKILLAGDYWDRPWICGHCLYLDFRTLGCRQPVVSIISIDLICLVETLAFQHFTANEVLGLLLCQKLKPILIVFAGCYSDYSGPAFPD